MVSSAVVTRVSCPTARPGVYTVRLVLVVLAALLTAGPGEAETIDGLTVEPTMVKGPARAPVTIVEFSDYQ